MTSGIRLDVFDERRDTDALCRILSRAFGGPEAGAVEWLTLIGAQNVRVVRDPEAVACLVQIPMGQFFGGRSVPMVGIAGVGVAPQRRGRGTALAMMSACLRELADSRVPLSGLYASTQSLYRKVGYEQAGHRFITRLHWNTLPHAGAGLEVRELADPDMPAAHACYRAFATHFDGMLDRGPYAWARVRKFREETFRGFGLFHDNSMEGHVFLTQRRRSTAGRHDVVLSDASFTTRRAGLAILDLLADFSMMAEEFELAGGPIHPLVSLLPQQRFSVERRDYWMLRVVSLPEAVRARGYNPGVRAEASIEIADDIIPSNAGTWSVRIADGRAECERSAPGRGTLRCTVGSLAAMYSGLYSAPQLRLMGLVEGSDAAVADASSVFPPSCPWMVDHF